MMVPLLAILLAQSASGNSVAKPSGLVQNSQGTEKEQGPFGMLGLLAADAAINNAIGEGPRDHPAWGSNNPWEHCEVDADFFEKSIKQFLPKEFRQKYHPAGQQWSLMQGEAADAEKMPLDQPYGENLNKKANRAYAEKKMRENMIGDYDREEMRMSLLQLSENPGSSSTVSSDLLKQAQLKLDNEEATEEKRASTAEFEAWYVNMNKDTERARCVEQQLLETGMQANRFKALEFPNKCLNADVTEHAPSCLRETGFGDCVAKGVDFDGINTHGSKGGDGRKMAYHIVSNWCGHKRLFEQLQNSNSSANYFIVLEDDVILDREWFMPVLQDFVANYENKDWDLLQIDPFGSKAKGDLDGHFRGKPVWQPGYLFDRNDPNSDIDKCRQYWGLHAIVVKKSGLGRINQWMSNQKAMPVDWVPTRMPNSLAIGALIARNPEERVYGRKIAIPGFCSQGITRSSIASSFIAESKEHKPSSFVAGALRPKGIFEEALMPAVSLAKGMDFHQSTGRAALDAEVAKASKLEEAKKAQATSQSAEWEAFDADDAEEKLEEQPRKSKIMMDLGDDDTVVEYPSRR